LWLTDARRSGLSLRSFACVRNATLMGVMTFLVFGLMVGLYRGNRLSYIIGDAQGFLFLTLATPFAYFARREKIKVEFFLSVFVVCTVIYSCLKALIYLGVYFNYVSLSAVTDLLVERGNQIASVRTSTGELRFATVGDLFPMLAFPLLAAVALTVKTWRSRVVLLAAITVVLLALTGSNSRGLWLGSFVGVIVLLVTTTTNQKLKIMAGIGVGFLGAVMLLPSTMGLLERRIELSVDLTEEGNLTRMDQAPKLIRAGLEHPIIGNGFGKTLPDLIRSLDYPYAYELQTLAFFMKMGIIGCAAWVIFLAWICRTLIAMGKRLPSRGHSMILRGMLGGVAALLFVGSINPHISSPTGMAYLALTVVVADLMRRQLPSRSEVRSTVPSVALPHAVTFRPGYRPGAVAWKRGKPTPSGR